LGLDTHSFEDRKKWGSQNRICLTFFGAEFPPFASTQRAEKGEGGADSLQRGKYNPD